MFMKKIAVVFNGDLSINRQGQLNSAICRIKHLTQLGLFEVDAYCVQEYSVGILRLLRKESLPEMKPSEMVDGIRVYLIYKPCCFISVLLETRLKLKSILEIVAFRNISKLFCRYDLISGHSVTGGIVGLAVKRRFGIPYCVTWHGSDIHTYPANNKLMRRQIAEVIKNASANIFVSQSLFETSRFFFKQCPNPQIIYNAAEATFYRYDDEKRLDLRKKWGLDHKKLVAYVGNMESVKNVQMLPRIFQCVQRKQENVAFWVIGDGSLRQNVENDMLEFGIQCVFWGNQQPSSMPEYMNCIDVLVLPSQNESFGMVLVEAISCGANVVGSKRGGIPEVIGEDNCFELNESFEDTISDRIVYMLNNQVRQDINNDFDWDISAQKEYRCFNDILNQ